MSREPTPWIVVGYLKGCRYCDAAKSLLAGLGENFVFADINRDPAERTPLEQAMRDLMHHSGFDAVPLIITPDGAILGGFSNLRPYLRSNGHTGI